MCAFVSVLKVVGSLVKECELREGEGGGCGGGDTAKAAGGGVNF